MDTHNASDIVFAQSYLVNMILQFCSVKVFRALTNTCKQLRAMDELYVPFARTINTWAYFRIAIMRDNYRAVSMFLHNMRLDKTIKSVLKTMIKYGARNCAQCFIEDCARDECDKKYWYSGRPLQQDDIGLILNYDIDRIIIVRSDHARDVFKILSVGIYCTKPTTHLLSTKESLINVYSAVSISVNQSAALRMILEYMCDTHSFHMPLSILCRLQIWKPQNARIFAHVIIQYIHGCGSIVWKDETQPATGCIDPQVEHPLRGCNICDVERYPIALGLSDDTARKLREIVRDCTLLGAIDVLRLATDNRYDGFKHRADWTSCSKKHMRTTVTKDILRNIEHITEVICAQCPRLRARETMPARMPYHVFDRYRKYLLRIIVHNFRSVISYNNVSRAIIDLMEAGDPMPRNEIKQILRASMDNTIAYMTLYSVMANYM